MPQTESFADALLAATGAPATGPAAKVATVARLLAPVAVPDFHSLYSSELADLYPTAPYFARRALMDALWAVHHAANTAVELIKACESPGLT